MLSALLALLLFLNYLSTLVVPHVVSCVVLLYRRRILSGPLSSFAISERNQYDYPDIQYPIPFSELFNNKNKRYLHFGLPFPYLNRRVVTGVIPSYSSQTSDVLMMTGASANHALASFNCLYSMVLADPYASYVYLDLGLSDQVRRILNTHFNVILQIQKKVVSNGTLAYRCLNWDSFPDWMSLTRNTVQRGGYSWKAIPLIDVFYEWKAVVYWLDAGCVITNGISRELSIARHFGLYSPESGGTVNDWVHNNTQLFMLENGMISHRVSGHLGMISGGVLVMDYANATVRNYIMPSYLQCAYTQKCISPRESNMMNHRQDQAVISLLMRYYDTIPLGRGDYRPALRHDYVKGMNNPTLNNLLLKIQDTYSIRINHESIRINPHYSRINYHVPSVPLDRDWRLH